MARQNLAVTVIDRSGTDIATLAAANADGHAVLNNGATFLIVKNAGGSGITVTVQTPRTIDGLAVAEYTISVGDGETKAFGPFPKDTFNQPGPDAGKVYVDYSAVTSVTVGAFRL